MATGKAPRHTARRNCVVILAGRAAGSTSHRSNQRFIQLSSLSLWENAGMMILHLATSIKAEHPQEKWRENGDANITICSQMVNCQVYVPGYQPMVRPLSCPQPNSIIFRELRIRHGPRRHCRTIQKEKKNLGVQQSLLLWLLCSYPRAT